MIVGCLGDISFAVFDSHVETMQAVFDHGPFSDRSISSISITSEDLHCIREPAPSRTAV